jgi:hypothetical protein
MRDDNHTKPRLSWPSEGMSEKLWNRSPLFRRSKNNPKIQTSPVFPPSGPAHFLGVFFKECHDPRDVAYWQGGNDRGAVSGAPFRWWLSAFPQ